MSNLTQALEREKNQEKNKKESDPETNSLSPHEPLKTRRRRWFGSKDGIKDKDRASSGGSPSDTGRTTGANSADASGSTSGRGTPARPITIQHSRKPSQYSAREGSLATSDSASTREKELANSHDRHDKWSTRAAGGTERAEREMGLSDEVQMALS